MKPSASAENQKDHSVPEAVTRAYKTDFRLNINRLDTAFLAGIRTYVEIHQTFSLAFSELEQVFSIVNELEQGNPDSQQQRTHRAVDRLIRNQLLIRVDGGGLSQQPLFDVSALGSSILSFLFYSDKLTKQNLTIITARILSLLSDIRKSMVSSGSGQFWEEAVLQPLKHVVIELLNAIQKRQRGLDLEQEEVRTQISRLLEKSWLEALEACESLLEITGQTLQELYRTLLSENTAIKQGLNEIYEAAESLNQVRVLNIIDMIYLRLDQLEQWGKERVISWSQYYRRVNDFLQSIVRFDPNRELSHALKERIQLFPRHPWYLQLIDPPVYRGLQEISYPAAKQRVVRSIPLPNQQPVPDDDGTLVLDLLIGEIKQRLNQQLPLNLAELIRPYLESHSLDQVYPHIGTLIDLILKELKQRPLDPATWEKPLATLHFELQNLVINPDQWLNTSSSELEPE
jgi:chromosome partition protein MukF